jgi:hypothetical protein
MKNIYLTLLPTICTSTLIISTYHGIRHCEWEYHNKTMSHLEQFADMIGFLSIGIMTGITYPFSFPCLGAYVIYKKLIQFHPKE